MRRRRIGADVVGFDEHAHAALNHCAEIHMRLVEGVRVLADKRNELALKAFRFTNSVMALQRIHSMYALARRRGEKVEVKDFDERKNHSWRPFQLAFVLLSLPSLADPTHTDRTKPAHGQCPSPSSCSAPGRMPYSLPTSSSRPVANFLAWCEQQGIELRRVTPGLADHFLPHYLALFS